MTALPCILALFVAGTPSSGQVLQLVRSDFEHAGRTAPAEDPSLSRAARQIAQRALSAGVEDAASLLRVTAAVSSHGGWDPSPTAVVIRGSPADVLKTLGKNELAEEPASLVGVALEQDDTRAAIAVLIARRYIDLAPFPRSLPRPATTSTRLCGTLRAPLTRAELFVTRPGGDVEHVDMTRDRDRLCADATFPTRGRHTVELLAHGPRGPQVAALFFVDVAGASTSEQDGVEPEPPTDVDARAQLLVRINALRLRMGLAPVQADPTLDEVASAWAQRLATENFFTHVAPDGSDLKQRLQTAGYAYVSAGENLGLSSGPLAAHFGIEHSPGHRRNLLEKDHQRLGIGLARRADGLSVLVEVLARPLDPNDTTEHNPLGSAYDAINAERAKRRLPKLSPQAVLEALAQQHARLALEHNLPKAQLPGQRRLHDQVFDALDDAKTVAIDVFIADHPNSVVESKNLVNTRSTMVGVGVVRGSSPQYGKDKYWIVVIYAGPT